MYEDDFFDDSDTTTEPDDTGKARNDSADLATLRKDMADLKELLGGRLDSAEHIQVLDSRRVLQERAERDARTMAAADDPATLEKMHQITTEEELIQFLRDNGATL